MTSKKLYIIGNGFDLQHGMKSSYWDFKEYLDDKDLDLIEKLEEYFGSDALWADFEETLAYLDTEQIVDECMNYLESYGAEDWSDAYHHNYQFEVQQRIDLITKTLRQKFTEWILQLRLPATATENMVVIDRTATFINFNYTDTLEQLYKISKENIFYIHNKAIDSKSILILGHSRNPQDNKTLEELYNDEDSDPRVAEGNRILDQYFEETYKSTETIIRENVKFFDRLSDVSVIYVFGHSLSVVDRLYFVEITKRIDKGKVGWKVSFYNKKNLIDFSEFFNGLGIKPELIEYDRMYNFDVNQLTLFSPKTE